MMLESSMKERYTVRQKLGPSIGNPIRNWMKMVLTNGSIALKYYPRVFLIYIISAIGVPFRIFEHWRLDKKVEVIKLKDAPVFILGHWRSGTTHLHNLIFVRFRYLLNQKNPP